MTWCNGFNDVRAAVEISLSPTAAAAGKKAAASLAVLVKMCPSCGHRAHYEQVRTHARLLRACPCIDCICSLVCADRSMVQFTYSIISACKFHLSVTKSNMGFPAANYVAGE